MATQWPAAISQANSRRGREITTIEGIKSIKTSVVEHDKTGANILLVWKANLARKPHLSQKQPSFRPPAPGTDTLRPYGLCAGQFTVPDDFDEPLPQDLMDLYEGK